jgi:hypothetical protein
MGKETLGKETLGKKTLSTRLVGVQAGKWAGWLVVM